MDWREEVRGLLDGHHPRVGRVVLYFIYGLIVLSTLSIGIETLPDLPAWARVLLALAELVTVLIFTIEYALRIAVAPDKLRYIRSFWGIIDLLAILPFYLALGLDLRAVRVLRLLRLFRLLKMVRYTHAADRLRNAFKAVREELIIFGTAAIVTLYLCAIGIYYFEHDAQPEKFRTVFDGIWWAAVTMTTVGYGDAYPITVGGRLFTIVVLLIALAVIAVPTGLISAALGRMRTFEEHYDAKTEPQKTDPAAKDRMG